MIESGNAESTTPTQWGRNWEDIAQEVIAAIFAEPIAQIRVFPQTKNMLK